jgi:hypothetical protein
MSLDTHKYFYQLVKPAAAVLRGHQAAAVTPPISHLYIWFWPTLVQALGIHLCFLRNLALLYIYVPYMTVYFQRGLTEPKKESF